MRRLGLAIALSLSLLVVAAPTASATWTPRKDLVTWMNQDRSGPNLRLGPRLSRIARIHSERMASRGRIFHSARLPCCYAGENVGVTWGSLRSLYRAFMASPPHRANILNPKFHRVGIGKTSRNGAVWITMIFVA